MELDKKVQASGFSKDETGAFDDAMEVYRQNAGAEADQVTDGSESEGEDDTQSEEDDGETEAAAEDETRQADGQETEEADKVTVAGEEFRMLQVTGEGELEEDGSSSRHQAGGDQDATHAIGGEDMSAENSATDEGEEEEGGVESSKAPRTGVMEAKPYDAKDDIRRAWRFSGRAPSRGGGGGEWSSTRTHCAGPACLCMPC
jgi:hypothetical protein